MCRPWVAVIVVSRGCFRTVERARTYFGASLCGVEPRYWVSNCDTYGNSMGLSHGVSVASDV